MDLRLVRVEFLQEGSTEHPSLVYGIKLMKNKQSTVLYLSTEPEFRRWKQFLAVNCIQTDFNRKYRVLQQIGKGSFAQVRSSEQAFLIEEVVSGERFAAKRFNALVVSTQKKGRESLLNEISLMKQLEHEDENIVKFYQVQESDGFVYLILEYLEGMTLYSFVKQNSSSLVMEDFKQIVRSVLSALNRLCSQDIIHRDLKPENLLFKSRSKPIAENTLKLIDFGLATRCHESEYLFKRCGTPGYASPEVINAKSGEKVLFTPKCDIFSAGILLYEL